MKILLADDNRLLLEGLANLLVAHGHDVVATAADGDEAIALARIHRPDVVLMDVRMPRRDGIAATRVITSEMPEMQVLMLTTSGDDEDLFESIRAGAAGYLLKSTTGDELIASIAGLADGVPPMSPGLAARLLREFALRSSARAGPDDAGRPARASEGAGLPGMAQGRVTNERRPPVPEPRQVRLTARQAEVLRAVAAGRTYKEVAALLGVSERTVRYHMSEIIDRLHFEHRSQVIAYAGEAGLLDGSSRDD